MPTSFQGKKRTNKLLKHWRCQSTTDSYQTAIRDNIVAGGDSCGRAMLLGAVLGATYGIGGQGIPQEWIDKLRIKDEIEQSLSRLFA